MGSSLIYLREGTRLGRVRTERRDKRREEMRGREENWDRVGEDRNEERGELTHWTERAVML